MSKERGIIIAVPKKYEKTCLLNVQNLRALNCLLPIEIWEIGEEISKETRVELKKIENVFFKNVNDFCNDSNHWKGFQVKAFILKLSTFKELILCDADVIIHQNPEILFNDVNYTETGTYFFKDLDSWQFSKLNNKLEQLKQKLIFNKFHNLDFFQKRKEWIKNILPEKKQNFPIEWDYIYLDEIPDWPVKEALQESGFVLINKEKQKDSIQNIYNLNNNHKETYQYIWGDKETFWIGCIMANQPFYFNPTAGYFSKKNNKLSHDYKGEVFFSQKG